MTGRESGMSLIETLIVLAIVGVMASIATISVGAATRGGNPEAEARRLSAHIRLAMDEALVTGTPVALAWDDTGYVFQVSASAPLAHRHDLHSGLHVEAATPETPFWILPDGDGPAANFTISGAGSPWHVAVDGFTALAAPGRAP